jgi:hypothetical protein
LPLCPANPARSGLWRSTGRCRSTNTGSGRHWQRLSGGGCLSVGVAYCKDDFCRESL